MSYLVIKTNLGETFIVNEKHINSKLTDMGCELLHKSYELADCIGFCKWKLGVEARKLTPKFNVIVLDESQPHVGICASAYYPASVNVKGSFKTKFDAIKYIKETYGGNIIPDDLVIRDSKTVVDKDAGVCQHRMITQERSGPYETVKSYDVLCEKCGLYKVEFVG